MFHMPISSPMIKTMLGFLSCAWAGATALKSAAVAISNDKPLCIKFRFILGFLLFGFGFVLMIFPRSCRPLYLLRRSGRPVFEPPAVVINLRMAIDYWLGWSLLISRT